MAKGPSGISGIGDLLGRATRDVLGSAYPDAIRRVGSAANVNGPYNADLNGVITTGSAPGAGSNGEELFVTIPAGAQFFVVQISVSGLSGGSEEYYQYGGSAGSGAGYIPRGLTQRFLDNAGATMTLIAGAPSTNIDGYAAITLGADNALGTVNFTYGFIF